MIIRIAFRNVLRNARRSASTLAAVVMGATALLLFGAFAAQVTQGLLTSTVQRTGHLSLFKNGYQAFGSGNPGAWSFGHWQQLVTMLRDDPELGPRINVVTPAVNLLGLAANPDGQASKTVAGLGVVPSDRNRFRTWDEHGLMDEGWRRRMEQPSGLSDSDSGLGIVGVGLARLLGLCAQVAECAKADGHSVAADGTPPRMNVLAASTGGAPNIVSLQVVRAAVQGQKDIDESFVAMNLAAAQRLLFGRGNDQVTSVVLQLKHTADIPLARARLETLIAREGLDLEVRSFDELTPFYGQAVAMFRALFGFITAIMATIVFFIVINTMNMNVFERTSEIGVTRAMGARRGSVRRLFLAEGWILGVLGASTGVGLALLIGTLFNGAGFMWTPPGQTSAIPMRLLLSGSWTLIAGVWLGLALLTTLAAIVPAHRASGLRIVDALRHA